MKWFIGCAVLAGLVMFSRFLTAQLHEDVRALSDAELDDCIEDARDFGESTSIYYDEKVRREAQP